jgi:hypothetical protein
MSTGGMNSFMNKWKYIMMFGLITGPQQPRNDINTYFRPLVEDLKVLWYNNGVLVWDEHKHEYFQLEAISFVTVSDSPVAHILLGQNKKVYCECPHCFREMDCQYLSESQKNSVHGTSTLHTNETLVSKYEGSIQW